MSMWNERQRVDECLDERQKLMVVWMRGRKWMNAWNERLRVDDCVDERQKLDEFVDER